MDRIVIGCAAEVIAEHVRSYDKDDIIFDPVHYLRLIERKIMAFDQAAPLQDWDLPDAFSTLQRLLEARQGKTGKREYVQVLRLLEHHEQNVLHAAIKGALQIGAISFPSHRYCVSTAGQWTPSNTLCCVALNAGSRDWISISIHSRPERMSPQHQPNPT